MAPLFCIEPEDLPLVCADQWQGSTACKLVQACSTPHGSRPEGYLSHEQAHPSATATRCPQQPIPHLPLPLIVHVAAIWPHAANLSAQSLASQHLMHLLDLLLLAFFKMALHLFGLPNMPGRSFDSMLDLKGNTAVYLLYAHARIAGIVRKVRAASS